MLSLLNITAIYIFTNWNKDTREIDEVDNGVHDRNGVRVKEEIRVGESDVTKGR